MCDGYVHCDEDLDVICILLTFFGLCRWLWLQYLGMSLNICDMLLY